MSMFHVRSAVCALALFSVAAPAAFAAAAAPATPASTASISERAAPGFWDFRLSQFSVFQGVGSSFAASFAWAPTFKLTDSMGLRPNLAAGIVKKGGATVDGFTPALITSLDALLTYDLNDSFTLEAGPGYQIWINMSAQAVTATGGGVYSFAKPVLWWIDGVAVDYTAAFITNNLTHEARVGVVF